jgi:formylglycine-generating enzyme required for sulfatase activity
MITLLVGIILGLVGWINQSYIANQWRWWIVTRPYAAAQVWPHVLSATQEEALKPADAFRECAQDCPEMVVIPAGSYTMGGSTRYEQPQHTVTFAKPFAVSKYELTFADWDACVKGGGRNDHKPNDSGWGHGRQPVIDVSWDNAQAYVAWLSEVSGKPYRLLSESEYEYAARAGTTTDYPWGDDIRLNGHAMANCIGCGSEWDSIQTAPVGSFPPNKFGLYDTGGNVLEWTEDCYHINYNGAPNDGAAWLEAGGADCSNRVLRGGCWNSSSDFVRSAYRGWITTGDRSNVLGFRVARALLAP